MQVIKKYIILVFLIVTQTVIGLDSHSDITNINQTWPDISNKIDDKSMNIKTENNKILNNATTDEFCDSTYIDSKLWMLKQNIIIGY